MTSDVMKAPAMPTDLVRKSLAVSEVRDFKMLGDDAGGFEGYANPFGKLDTVGDITMPNAFADAIDGFLRHGFIPKDHEWSNRVGYPTAASEDAYGLFIACRFHSHQRGQDARIEATERIDNGLSERLSIGFTIAEFEYVKGADAVAYLINPTDEEIARCAAMARVRLIHKVKQLFEVSLVSVPAAPGSDVIGVKSADGSVDAGTVDTATEKGIHLGDGVEEGAACYVIQNLIDRFMWRVVYDVLFSGGDTPTSTKLDVLGEALDEMKESVTRIVGALLDSADAVAIDEAKADLAAILAIATKEDSGAAPVRRPAHTESVEVLAAVAAHVQREKSIAALRAASSKAGRRHSRATTERVSTHIAALRSSADDLEQMLRDGIPDADDEPMTVLGEKADPTAPETAQAEASTDAATTDDAPTYIDPEVANGLYAALLTTIGTTTHD